MPEVTCTWEDKAILGEGPLWIEAEQSVYWVDIYGKKLHRYTPETNTHSCKQYDKEITSIAPRAQGGFIATLKDGFYLLDKALEPIEYLGAVEPQHPNNRFNDGKLDCYGNYWAGTMDDEQKQATGSLYRLDSHLD